MRDELRSQGITDLASVEPGRRSGAFRPEASARAVMRDLPRPIQLYVGRVAVEKNIEAFLAAASPGTKVVVGDGPARAALERRYPDATSWAFSMASSWPALMRVPMCSFFPAAPTLSGW